MAHPGQRSDAATDPGRPCRRVLRVVSLGIPHGAGTAPEPAPATSCVSGPDWVTTVGPSTCTGRPWRSRRSTEVSSPRTSEPCGALAGVGPYTARAVQAFAFEARCGPRRHQCGSHSGALRRRDRSDGQRGAEVGRPPVAGGTLLGVQPGHVRPRAPRSAPRPGPACGVCPLRHQCRWRRQGADRPRPVAGQPLGAAPVAVRRLGPSKAEDASSTPCAGVASAAADAGRGMRLVRAIVRGPSGSPMPSWPRVSPGGRRVAHRSSACTEKSALTWCSSTMRRMHRPKHGYRRRR